MPFCPDLVCGAQTHTNTLVSGIEARAEHTLTTAWISIRPSSIKRIKKRKTLSHNPKWRQPFQRSRNAARNAVNDVLNAAAAEKQNFSLECGRYVTSSCSHCTFLLLQRCFFACANSKRNEYDYIIEWQWKWVFRFRFNLNSNSLEWEKDVEISEQYERHFIVVSRFKHLISSIVVFRIANCDSATFSCIPLNHRKLANWNRNEVLQWGRRYEHLRVFSFHLDNSFVRKKSRLIKEQGRIT